jgi:hypothetical protein
MKAIPWVAGLALLIALLTSAAAPATAHYLRCVDGQMPAPPEIAAQMALPLCGFAATKRWGPNGCQLCDARNVYPNPYWDQADRDAGPRARGARRGYGYQPY